MSPAEALATTLAAGAGLYASYRIVMWLANRVIDSLSEMSRFED